ncbi:MAG: PAS domain S-box protein [Candidatus Melainabacteria bacterium]|nr:PAS domain S-box protein [Candidatus Melainabacteria bacterium]
MRVKQQKIQLEHCETLASGLRRLAQGGIDIVFLDLSLPDSHGLETVAKVRNEYSVVPVVVLTGSDDDALAVQVLKAGAQDYLVKGQLDPSSLGRSIKYAIERQRSTIALQWLEAVVNGSNDAIIGLSEHNKIVSWNPGAERIFNYSFSEAIGRPIEDFLPLHVVNAKSLNERCKRKEKLEPYEATYLSRDGRETTVYISTSPICDAEGLNTGVSLIAHDLTQQRQTEQILVETHERLELSLSAAKIGLWELDLRKNTVQWDSNMNQLLGLPNDAAQTIQTFLSAIHPEDLNKVILKPQDLDAMDKNYLDQDFRAVWSDGTIRNLVSKSEVFRDRDAQPLRITGACFDDTERTNAQNALRESGERLRLALESVGMGVWDWDLITNEVWRSPQHDQVYGYDSMLPEWSYGTFLSHVVAEDRPEVEENIKHALSHGDLSIQCRIKASDNSIRWIKLLGETKKDSNELPVRMVGSIRDITKAMHLEQQAQEATKRRELILQDIVEQAPIGIVILDSKLKITTANCAFSSMIQKEQSSLLGQSLKEILPSEAHPSVEKAVASGEQLQVARLKVTIANQLTAAPKYWDLSLWPVSNDDGEILEVVLQVFDCTATVLLEQQRDDFVASVAHDIKNPLIGAERVFSVLCEQASSESLESYSKMLTLLRDGNQNLLSLVQNLVDVYRYETLSYPCNFEDMDLESTIRSCIKQITHFADSHNVTVKLHNRVPRDASFIQADAIGIRRVVMNLLHNAVKFNKEGGTIEITIEQLDHSVSVHVRDTGLGIDAGEQPKLFQRFAQGTNGKATSGGTGLGLYLSKQILEAHKGEITCNSTMGVGTEFVFTLPILQGIENAHKDSDS